MEKIVDEDEELLDLALKRIEANSRIISEEEFDKLFPISEEELEGWESIEFE